MYRIYLDDDAKRELHRQMHLPGLSPGRRIRLETVRLSDRGWRVRTIAWHVRRCEATVCYWIAAYLRAGFEGLIAGEATLADESPLGQPSATTPDLTTAFHRLLSDEAAGDPMGEQKWTRKSPARLARALQERGFTVSKSTIYRLLIGMGYSFKGNLKRRRGHNSDDPRVNQQFTYIATQKDVFITARLPIISVDTKKKELIGDFMRKGKTWCKDNTEEVNYNDFPSHAVCRAVPYGVYDVQNNLGNVYVGTSADTAEFAVDAIRRWWTENGSLLYPAADKPLILCDGGGSNSRSCRAWKAQIQKKLSDELRLTVTICHYPPRMLKMESSGANAVQSNQH